MGPAQSATYRKQIPTGPGGLLPARAAGVPLIPNADTGPYLRAIAPRMSGACWAYGNPTAVGMGFNQTGNDPNPSDRVATGAKRELVWYGRPRPRSNDLYAPGDGPGLSGPYEGLGLQPREALPTARTAIVARVGNNVTGGNPHAFLPPPDKFLVLNLFKVAPIGTAIDLSNWGHLGGTTAPTGNG